MNVINVELYSIIILIVLISNYIIKFRKRFNIASFIWLCLAISTISISLSSIHLSVSSIYKVKLIAVIMYLLSTIVSSLMVYIYIKLVYINDTFNIKKELIAFFSCIIIVVLFTVAYIFVFNTGYVLHSFDRSYFNKLLCISIIPNVAIVISYTIDVIKKGKQINWKIVFTILITIIGLIIDSITDSLFLVSSAFTITTLIIYINKHESLMNTDPLTGLANKRSLELFVENIRSNTTIAVYNIDVNRFKTINDKYGHLEGDKVLKDVAKVLRNSSRDKDLVIRNGGDEFLIVAVIRNKDDASKVVERINNNLDNYNKNARIKISISLGWGIYESRNEKSKEEFEEFLKKIDDEMYVEKEILHKKQK